MTIYLTPIHPYASLTTFFINTRRFNFFVLLALITVSFAITCNNIESRHTTQPPFFDTDKTKAEALLNSLTIDEKIGQLFMVAAVSDEEQNEDIILSQPYHMDKEYIEELIRKYHIGGIIFLGRSTPEQQIALTTHFQNLSVIPLLIGQDLEPGFIMSKRFPTVEQFPDAAILGTYNDDEVYAIGAKLAALCKELGVHINFAPVTDVNTNPDNPIINNRSFGTTPELVTQKAIAFMRGLQDNGIFACAKHFPGHGDTKIDSHSGLPRVPHTRERLDRVELPPFISLIDSGIACVMIAHLEVPALEPEANRPTSLSRNVVTNLLQKEFGFEGLVFTDALNMQGIVKHFQPGKIELNALLAGNDILLCPMDVPKSIALIKQSLNEGKISVEELDHHVLKILRAKQWIFEHLK